MCAHGPPGRVGEALGGMRQGGVHPGALADHASRSVLDAKRDEGDEYRTQVSDWAVERYLEQF